MSTGSQLIYNQFPKAQQVKRGRGTRKVIKKIIQSMQLDCSNITSAGYIVLWYSYAILTVICLQYIAIIPSHTCTFSSL